MRLGIHIPLKGGFEKNIKRAREMGCETVQLFPGNPGGWRLGEVVPEELLQRAAFAEEQGIRPLILHGAYLINLASPRAEFLEKSKKLLKDTMARAALYRAPYVVLHTGNHGGLGVEQGLEQIMEIIAAELPNWPKQVTLLLENTAGSGTALGARFEELARLLKAFPPGTLGVCLDTAHAWGAGYDFSSAAGVVESLEQFDRLIGLEQLKAVHVNDSKAECGSRVDRHEHIGRGRMGLEGFRALLQVDWPPDLPFILETPEIGSDWDRVNMETLYSLCKQV